MILHLTKDLMLSSTASATARACGKEYRFAGSLVKLDAAMQKDEFNLLLVDLQTPGIDLEKMTEIISQSFTGEGRKAIAYAQHVEVDLLENAKQCGFESIMTRGQFNSGLQQLFSNLN